MTSALLALRSAKLVTGTTSASSPPGGVATVPPSPSTTTGCRAGSMISALSTPRTQLGTITRSARTFSRPSAFIVSMAHATARAMFSDALIRLPKVSVRVASRCHAKSSRVASSIRRAASAR